MKRNVLRLVTALVATTSSAACSRPPEKGIWADAEAGNITAMRADLTSKTDVNAEGQNSGKTPLIWAIESDRPDAVQLLIGSGADVNKVMANNWTPLMEAVAGPKADPKIVAALIAARADVNGIFIKGLHTQGRITGEPL